MENQTTCPSLIADILRQCRTNPSRVAVIDGQERVNSYGEFYTIAKRTCGYIKSRGLAKGSFVVINLPGSMEYLAVELGSWLAGCAIVPVNPSYPKARTDYIVSICESALVVDEAVLEEIRQAEPLDVCEPVSDIAALFFTSGSTGNPKGVIHTFDTLSVLDCYNEIVQVVLSDRFATGAPLSFVAGMMNFVFLRAGASVRLIGRETMTDVRKLQDFFDREDMTVAFLNPSLLRQLRLGGNGKLHTVITGSERVSGLKSGQGYVLVNVYGMTETLGPISHYNVDEESPNSPIGKFFSKIDARIADDGEICLRGPLSPGYYKDAERSAALWSGGWLHTGDIGRLLPDGNFQYLDRKDWMVKINGQRVETGEINQVIKDVPGVHDAVAKGFTTADGHQYIAAYYVADDAVGEDTVREFISRRLAPYMIPSCFVKMAALPLNANGKVDVKSLQSPLEMRISEAREVTAPVGENEKALCKAFESALGVSPVGVEDDFFSLGGDSIRVMQLQLACPQLNLSTPLIYRFRTVRAICSALEAEAHQVQESAGDSCPLSQTQAGIFVECMAHRGEVSYNNPFLYRFKGAMDPARLAEACVTTMKAHPGLFASIRVDEKGNAVQQRNSSEDFTVGVETVSDKEFALIRAGLVQPFDLLSDRLFRIRVFRTESDVWLFTDFHHIVFDGGSNDILLKDIETAYDGGTVQEESCTGFDLAFEEQGLRRGEFFEECRKWNVDTFCEADSTSLPDPDSPGGAPAFRKLETPTGISIHGFAKAAERLGVTENVLSLAAFGHMLGSCTHSRSSSFATIYNGRKSIRSARTVSMMVKTLPVLCKWADNTSVGEYIGAVREQLSAAMAHDLFSFAEICSATAYDSRVIFSYQNDLLERDCLCGVACEMTSLLENATGEPLTVQLYKSGGALAIRTEYRRDMYSEKYVSSLISCFKTILSALMQSGKDTPLSEIGLVDSEEGEAIIRSGWGRTLEFDRSRTFVDMFRSQVAEHPEGVAVVDENGSMTYAELDRLSDRLASLLVGKGVRPGDFVSVILPRLNLFPISYIACFKAGAAYVPMDYEYPVDRLQYMMEDSESKVLLTTRGVLDMKLAEGLKGIPQTIFVDELACRADSSSDECAAIDRSAPDGLAYMIYTSGTTGKPKGVMIEHHSLANLVHWYADSFGITYGTRLAEHASFSFDGSVTELMTPLCFGGQLHILSSSIRKDLAAMYRYFCENRIDGTLLTTQLGMTMLRMYDLKLKYLVVGGEKLKGQFKTSVKLYNGYGPTEFTVASSYYPVDTENLPDNIPIGKAVPNTLSAVVDSCGRLLPQGIAGELVLVGEQLSRGYWHRPDITSERFTVCPFLKDRKMYHTGDLVKWDENGDLLFLGRIDSQIKLRGFRIELGEIESNLSKFAGIRASVVAVKEIAGLQHLCAYYVSDTLIDKDELRKHLSASLTDYMVPTAYVQMDALPMTPNGKVDLRRLPVPEVKAEEITAPSGEVESGIFEVVAEYLGNRDFGVTTNLISMGLTSLGAITLSLQIERKISLSIPSPKILEYPTIRQWAEYLGASASDARADVKSYDILEEYPMTDNQTGVYIDWEQHRDSVQYNVPMLFRFKGVAPEAVVAAVKSFVEAHPYLKTHLRQAGNRTVQVRDDMLPVEIAVQSLDSEPDKAFFQKLLRPFNLFEGPLFRFSVFTYADSVWLLSDIHHIIFDGGSEAVFAKELVDACNGAELVPEKFSAFDYSLHYEEWKESEEFGKAEQYFTSLLEGTVAGTIPSTVSAQGRGSATISLSIPRKALSSLCRKVSVTENALFLSAVTEVLHRFSREDNIAILTVSNGRSLRSLERTCGMFVQTLPVVSHTARRSVRESLTMMHSQIVETLDRDKFPYTRIVEMTGLKAGILLAYQGDVLGGPLSVGGNVVEMTGLALDEAKFPLSINVMPGSQDTVMDFEYDRAVFSETDVEHYAQAVRSFIENMVGCDAGTPVGDIPCVSAADGEALVALGSGPSLDVADGTIVDLFRKSVSEHPDDNAVADESGTLSYAGLDKASDLVAGILLSAGLRSEEFVSLMLPRCKEYVVAYMAVFKSGGAYVPMDYEYPIERLQYMVDDSMSRFLVTTHELYGQKSAEGGLAVENVIFIDDVDFSVASSAAAVNRSSSASLAYMIYTSGTTGKPKGVMIEHRCLMNMIHWNRDLAEIGRGTHIAEHASFSFDASIMDLMTTIAFGAELFIIPESCRKDPEAMYRYLVDNRIEGMVSSTQFGMMMLSSYKLPIRYIMLGGEKLTGKYDRAIKVVNGYGPTEFTVCSSYYVLDPDNELENIPIGRAVPNTVSAIVDSWGQLVPRGVPGELVLIGPQIARGYWNKDEITHKRFVDCPFIPGARMYHTGDLVRWNEDGELMFMGRIDTQVKLRGFRIELGEIESRITAFPGVTASVAQVREFGGTQHLCAYFTASASVDTAALKSHLASSLTAYMVPDALMQLDAFPLTPNGKVDLKKLPQPELGKISADAYEAPEGEIETAIAEAFNKALGTDEPLGRNDSFFNVGGTSLQVMKVIVALSGQGYEVTYSDIFKYPTPRTLAAFIEGYRTANVAAAPAQVPPEVVEPGKQENPGFDKGDDGFDYTGINALLKSNGISQIGDIGELDVNPLGDVLLLGSTGYLGIHVLYRLLAESDSKVYCVVRAKKGVSCEGRLKSFLMYYFDRTFSDLVGKRLFVIEGDITDASIMDTLLQIKVDTVINCAANVKHFAAGDEIEKINLNGTERLVEYCLKTGSRLIHTSTHSISGQSADGVPHIMLESDLYFGQRLMTKYQTSKFAAERAILDACVKNGLRAKIMRLGNLMPRFSDGEFQINMENNGFMSRMRAYYLIGCIASEHLHSALEFAPIDATADAVLTLARTPDKFTVFHPFNNHTIYVDDVVAVMRKCGLPVKVTGNDEFNSRLEACLKDDHLNPLITTLLAYGNHNNYVVNPPSLDFTVSVLNAMDWRWPITGIRYLSDAFEKLISLEYFDR